LDKKLVFISALLVISLATNLFLSEYILFEHEKLIETCPTQKVVSSPIKIIKAPAVTDDGEGVIIEISVKILEGDGQILVNTEPLTGVSFQESARTAVQVTSELLSVDFSDANVIFTVTTIDATVVDGPSAGASMTTLVYSAITGSIVNQSIMMTGTIEIDGSIGKVGSIMEKIEASSEIGVKTFLVPQGQTVQTNWIKREEIIDFWIFKFVRVFYEPETIDFVEYAWENYSIKLIEVGGIDQILNLALIKT